LYTEYADENINVEVNNSMLIPIKNQKDRVIAILEVTNVQQSLFGFDQEYLGLILTNFCSFKIKNALKYDI